MTQTIEYVVKVNATQAQAAVAEVEKRFGGVDTVVARVDKSIIALERDMKDLNAAIAAGGPNVAVYKRQLEDLRNALYGAPGSSGRGGAGGGMGVGMAALETSRAVEDLQYGLSGVVNNIPGIVMALGGGAGLTAAISLGAVAVNQLAKNFGLIDPAAKQAASAAADHMQTLRGEIAGLQRDLRSLQVGAERAAMEAQGEAVGRAAQAAEAALAPLGGLGRFERLEGISGLPLTIREQMDAARKAMDLLNAETAKLAGMRRIQLEKESQRAIEIAVDTANAQEEAYQNARKGGQKAAVEEMKIESGDDSAANRRLEAEQEAREKANERMLDAQLRADEKAEKERQKAAENAAKIMDSYREKELEKLEESLESQRQAWKDFGSGFVDLGIGMFGPVANASQQFFDDIITGQEHAAEMMGVSLMRTAGDALVGHGINLLGQSVVSAFTPALQPLAAAQAGAGATLVAAGMGLGAGATAASHTLAGGTIGKPLDDKQSTRDPGASPRSSGGGGSGGPLIVNVAYGAGGPLPEDIAREIHRVTSSGNRRRGAA